MNKASQSAHALMTGGGMSQGISTKQLLPSPSVLEAVENNLADTLERATVRIPAYPKMAANQLGQCPGAVRIYEVGSANTFRCDYNTINAGGWFLTRTKPAG
ncbi:hypothetical protein [Pseudomonas sp. RC2C2]|nr:hypothetical protein [Pseudomonas sp. RC2C2]MBS7601044.1 hypothetical protein [Pseudomonas sp. RC2C2]